MIKIAIVDLSRALDGLDRSKRKSVQSKFARLLLEKLFVDFFDGKSIPKLKKGRYGKPYFEQGAPFFNITHERALTAVIMSDEGEVGIDVQSLPESFASRKKISERLTAVIRECDYYFTRAGMSPEASAEILFFDTDGEELIPSASPSKNMIYRESPATLCSEDAEFLREWCELEALMKLSGGGFADVGRIPEIMADANIKSLYVSDSNATEYAFTYAVRKSCAKI